MRETRIIKRTFATGKVLWVVQYRFIREIWVDEASYRWRWRARLRKMISDAQEAEWTVVDEQVDGQRREGDEG